MPPEAVRNGPNYLGSNCVPPISNYSYVILAALIHDDDVFRVLEEKFCASNIAISRALVNLSVELNLRQDISEVIAHSRQFDGFESRLFGPQEEEIGEEGKIFNCDRFCIYIDETVLFRNESDSLCKGL